MKVLRQYLFPSARHWCRWLRRSFQVLLFFLSALTLPITGGSTEAPRSAGDLFPRLGSWPEFTRGPAWDIALKAQYAFVAIGEGGLAVFDVTDPAQPVRAGEYLLAGRTRQVLVTGSRAYLRTSVPRERSAFETDSGRGCLVILDVSDPTRPTPLGSYFTRTPIQSLSVDGNRVYIGTGADSPGNNHADHSFRILDVSDPARPVVLHVEHEEGFGVRSIWAGGGRAYVAWHAEELRVLDVSEPAFPKVLAEVSTDPEAGSRLLAMRAVGDVLFVLRQEDSWSSLRYNSLSIYNASIPSAPQLLGVLEFNHARVDQSNLRYPVDFEVVGDHAYLAMGASGMVAINVSNPAMPALAGTWDTPGVALGVEVAGSHAFVADYHAGFHVIDIRDPVQISRVTSVDTGLTTRAIRLSGNTAYSLSSDGHPYPYAKEWVEVRSRVEAVNVRNPTRPELLGAYDSDRLITSLDVAGDLAYLGWTQVSRTGLQILDWRNPLRPVTLSDTAIPSGVSGDGVRAVGHYAYVSSVDLEGTMLKRSLRIFGVSDPVMPVPLSRSEIGKGSASVPIMPAEWRVSGGHVYLNGLDQFEVLDVTDPQAPAAVGAIRLGGSPGGLCISGDYAYVGGGWFGLSIVDLRDPENPVVTGQHVTLGHVRDLSSDDSYVYAAEGWGGIEVFDVRDPAKPRLIGGSQTSGQALGIEVSGDCAYVAESGGGLAVLSLNPELVRVVEEPASLRVAAGDTGTLTVRAYGRGPLTYQWYLGERGETARPAEGGTGWAFTTPALTNESTWWVRITSATGAADSRTARLSLATPVSVELAGLWPGERRQSSIIGVPFARDVAVSGHYAYLADGSGGLRIIDVSDPAQPISVGVHASQARGVAVSGEYVYLVADTVQVLDVSDPARLRPIANLSDNFASDIFLNGEFAYLPSLGLNIFDIRNPASPKILTSEALPEIGGNSMSFAGPYAAVGGGEGLQILDLSDPSELRWSGAYYPDAPVQDVAWLGRFVCATVGLELAGLEVIDLTDFHRPVRTAKVSLPRAHNVALMGSYACVTGEGLRVFDLSDPFHPAQVGSHQLGSGPGAETRGLQVIGNLVYVAAGECGLAIYRLTPLLRLNLPVWDASGLRMSWLGAPGIRLQRVTTLSASDWQDVPGSEGASSVELSLTDSAAFFRLLKP